MTSHSKAVNDIDKMLARLDRQDEQQQPNLSAKQEYWRGQADNQALKANKPMVVVNNGGSCQVWNKSIADKCGAEYDYVAGGNK